MYDTTKYEYTFNYHWLTILVYFITRLSSLFWKSVIKINFADVLLFRRNPELILNFHFPIYNLRSHRTHHPDSLHGEQHRAEEERHATEGCHCVTLTKGRHVVEHVVSNDGEADCGHQVGEGAEGCQELEVAHPVDQGEGYEEDHQVDPHVDRVYVLVHYLCSASSY